MTDYLFALSVGFLGSLHCLGMCGPLLFAYSLHAVKPEELKGGQGVHPLRNGLLHHLVFHAGRLTTYGLLGALAAGIFELAAFLTVMRGLRSGATLVGGLLMIAIGLSLLRLFPVPALFSRVLLPVFWQRRLLQALAGSQRLGAKAILGFFAGFLPCGLSWAMIIKAAGSGSVLHGFTTMALFGAGTVPTLLATGMLSSIFTLELRLIGERMAALAVIFMGIFMVASGAGLPV